MSAFPKPSRRRLLELQKLSCEIFNTTFNPTNQRTGAKILRQPLKGTTVANYYGDPDFLKFKDVQKIYKFQEFGLINEEEEYRLMVNASRRRRGKGAPPKKKEASSSDGKKKKKR
ncbi:BA75_04024T0 [Komagataella pastoris]|uniref:Small ribosomal subunit protein mS33 n=1 Tax=Komagataella pastoris TaxID=4922 RepID=A0A1B2JEM4_PICPA|nr:BA75_04024T0 [Komagataella pastoris]